MWDGSKSWHLHMGRRTPREEPCGILGRPFATATMITVAVAQELFESWAVPKSLYAPVAMQFESWAQQMAQDSGSVTLRGAA